MMRATYFLVGLAIVSFGIWALLAWLGFAFVAFILAVTVFVAGAVAYVAVRAGVHDAATSRGARGHQQA